MTAVREKGVDVRGLSQVGLKTFFKIAEKWGLSAKEQRILLGIQAASTFFKWKKEPPQQLPLDTLERMSYILGIFKALQILLPDSETADAWIRQPNAAIPFGGRPALDFMLNGRVADLYLVRQYLDSERGG